MAPVFWSNLIILPYVNFVCIEIIFFFFEKIIDCLSLVEFGNILAILVKFFFFWIHKGMVSSFF